MSIGTRLASLRRESGLTQTELAGRIGTTQGHVSRIERSDNIEWLTMVRYVKACDVTSFWVEVAP